MEHDDIQALIQKHEHDPSGFLDLLDNSVSNAKARNLPLAASLLKVIDGKFEELMTNIRGDDAQEKSALWFSISEAFNSQSCSREDAQTFFHALWIHVGDSTFRKSAILRASMQRMDLREEILKQHGNMFRELPVVDEYSKKSCLEVFAALPDEHAETLSSALEFIKAMKSVFASGASIPVEKAVNLAAATDDENRLLALIEEFPAAINTKDRRGNTPLLNALERGKDHAVKLLLDKGADPFITNVDGDDAYLCAIRYKRVSALAMLLEARPLKKGELEILKIVNRSPLLEAVIDAQIAKDAIAKALPSASLPKPL